MWRNINDYELLYLIHQKVEIAEHELVEKYKRVIWMLIQSCLNRYHPRGVEKEDLYQESLIALMEAVRSYREDYNAPFYSFVSLCVERYIKTYLRKYNSQSTRQFYHCLSLDMMIADAENLYLHDVIPDEKSGQSYLSLYENELEEFMNQKHDMFSIKEKQIFYLKIQGYSYDEIASRMNCNAKQVDNTIQKIKRFMRN